MNTPGVYILENNWGGNRPRHLGEKYEKEKRKRGKMEENKEEEGKKKE